MGFFRKKRKNKKPKGRLAVDVYKDGENIVIIAPLSNIKPEDMDIYVEKKRVEIKGERKAPAEEQEADEFIHKECYWGTFEREINLPEPVDSNNAEAYFYEGLIKLVLPKLNSISRKKSP